MIYIFTLYFIDMIDINNETYAYQTRTRTRTNC